MNGSQQRGLPELRLSPRRSLFVSACGVISRACIWVLLVYALHYIVPRTLTALQGINPKLQIPRNPLTVLINFMCQPQKSLRLAAYFLLLIDLPISYVVSNNIASRRFWGRLMMLIPLAIGLAAGGGFFVLYMQLISLQIKEVGG